MSISVTMENNNLPVVKSKNYARLPQVLEIPNLIQVQLDSFRWFMEEGVRDLLQEVSPIKDFTGQKMELSFAGYEFRPPQTMLPSAARGTGAISPTCMSRPAC